MPGLTGCARWQNSIATSCPRQVNPRACLSALCFATAFSKPVGVIRLNICANMLHTRFMVEVSCFNCFRFSPNPISIYRTFHHFFKKLIWTLVVVIGVRQQPNCQ